MSSSERQGLARLWANSQEMTEKTGGAVSEIADAARLSHYDVGVQAAAVLLKLGRDLSDQADFGLDKEAVIGLLRGLGKTMAKAMRPAKAIGQRTARQFGAKLPGYAAKTEKFIRQHPWTSVGGAYLGGKALD